MLAYRRKEHWITCMDLSHIEEYTKEDLMNPEEIEVIYKFIYGYYIHITTSGWNFLIEYYGYEGLYQIDKNCKCCFNKEGEDNSLEEYIKWINGRIKSYPDVPDSVYKDRRPKNIVKTVLLVKNAEEVAEMFELPIECVQEFDRELQEERAEYEKEQNKQKVPEYLRAGKTAEEIAAELDISIEYVQELNRRIRESKIMTEKLKNIVSALREGKSAEGLAEKYEVPLEFVQKYERVYRKP